MEPDDHKAKMKWLQAPDGLCFPHPVISTAAHTEAGTCLAVPVWAAQYHTDFFF